MRSVQPAALSPAGPSPGISLFVDSEDTSAEEPGRRGETQPYNLYTWIRDRKKKEEKKAFNLINKHFIFSHIQVIQH